MLIPISGLFLSVLLVLPCASAAEGKPTSLSLRKRSSNAVGDLVKAEKRHISRSLLGYPSGDTATTYAAGNCYYTNIAFGDEIIEALIDTGSSITLVTKDWGGLEFNYTLVPGETVNLVYGSDEEPSTGEGPLVTTQVSLSESLTIENQEVAIILNISGDALEGDPGILGLAAKVWSLGMVLGADGQVLNKTVPTFLDNLYMQGKIDKRAVSFYFYLNETVTDGTGEMTFGGINEDLQSGPFITAPPPPANEFVYSLNSKFYSIEVSQMFYEAEPLLEEPQLCVIDLGSSLIYLPSAAFGVVQRISNATFDPEYGLLILPKSDLNKLLPLVVDLGTGLLDVIPDAQIYGFPDGPENYYLVFANGTANGWDQPQCILGMSLLERFHVLFELFGETGPGQVSFATTPDTYGIFNTLS